MQWSLLRMGCVSRSRKSALSLLFLIGSGCGTLPDGRRWGEEATLTPGLARVGRAAARAALEPATWLPALGAVAFTIDRFDRKVSDWAVDRTPIFGSPPDASRASHVLEQVSMAGMVGTALAAPGGEEPGEWFLSKARGLGVEGGALLATSGVSEGLKLVVNRARPGRGHSRSSFPSGHSSYAFAAAAGTSRNLESLSLPGAIRVGARAGAYTIAGATAWARVEAQKHFPSDVLAGAAIGNFLGTFIHDAFLGLGEKGFPEVSIGSIDGGGFVEIGWSF